MGVRPDLDAGAGQSIGHLQFVPALDRTATVATPSPMHVELPMNRPAARNYSLRKDGQSDAGAFTDSLETAAASIGTAFSGLAAGKRGLKTGLKGRKRTVLLMLDETILTELPPLSGGYGRIGEQVRVPITGQHGRRVLHGALAVQSRDVLLAVTDTWNQWTHQEFLRQIRGH